MEKVFKLWVEEDGLEIIENEYYLTFNKALEGKDELVKQLFEGIEFKLTQFQENDLASYYDKDTKIGVYIKGEKVS